MPSELPSHLREKKRRGVKEAQRVRVARKKENLEQLA
jgi:hypothetical protein